VTLRARLSESLPKRTALQRRVARASGGNDNRAPSARSCGPRPHWTRDADRNVLRLPPAQL